MTDYDHQYTLAVRPNAHFRIAYSTDDETVSEAFLAVEYGRDGIDAGEDDGSGIEWRGYRIALARDGEDVLGGGIEGTLDRGIERALDRDTRFVDTERVKRGVGAASGYGRRVKDRLGEFRDRRAGGDETVAPSGVGEPPETIAVPGPGDATIDVSLAETAATFELYEDGSGDWRWRLVHENGDTLGVSATGYDSREEAEETITALKTHALGAEVAE